MTYCKKSNIVDNLLIEERSRKREKEIREKEIREKVKKERIKECVYELTNFTPLEI
jgi:hypothetical protein